MKTGKTCVVCGCKNTTPSDRNICYRCMRLAGERYNAPDPKRIRHHHHEYVVKLADYEPPGVTIARITMDMPTMSFTERLEIAREYIKQIKQQRQNENRKKRGHRVPKMRCHKFAPRAIQHIA